MSKKRKHSTSASAEDIEPVAIPGPQAAMEIDSLTESSWEVKDQYYKQLYSKAPDFKQLARLDPDFQAVTRGRELDFNDPKAVIQLTKTLLKLDFGLHVELPDDRLCPPVANRHNYILWLKALTDTTTSYEKPPQPLVVIDIGTGASCIYPLLGVTQRPWSFIGTDIDEKSIEHARRNVALNGLQGRIMLLKREPTDDLIPGDVVVEGRRLEEEEEGVALVMTNPPFFRDEEEMLRGAGEKSRPPFTACTGSRTEMVTPGGEVGFVERILAESMRWKGRIQWYTAMLGFLSSVRTIVDKLTEHGINNYAVTEFVQGNKTRRWAVGWSFRPMRPKMNVARGLTMAKSMLPMPSEATVLRFPRPSTIGLFADHLSTAIGQLELFSWEWDRVKMEGLGRAVDKVWARAWRRRRKKKKMEGEVVKEQQEEEEEVRRREDDEMFGFMVWIRVGADVSVGCRWVEGFDGSIFESFQGYLKAVSEAARKSE